MGQLEGKVALITGAASGIGKATAALFLREGASLTLIDLQKSALDAVAAELKSERVAVVPADVAEPKDAERYVEETVRRFGGLDIAVFNVGIAGEISPIPKATLETFDRVMAVNVRGTWLGLKYAIPRIAERGGGSIVMTASTAGFRSGAPG